MALEILGCRLVAANLEGTELLPLPDWTCDVSMSGVGYVESRITHCRGWWSERRRYEHQGFCGEPSSPGRDRCQREPKTRWGFWRRSRSRSGWHQYCGTRRVLEQQATYLVSLLLLQLLKDLLRLSLGSKRHVDARFLYNQTRGCVVRGRVLKTALRLGVGTAYWAPAKGSNTNKPNAVNLASSAALHVCPIFLLFVIGHGLYPADLYSIRVMTMI